MKELEVLKKLKKLGVTVEHGRRHYHLSYRGKTTIMKRHPTQDFPNVYLSNILKELNLK